MDGERREPGLRLLVVDDDIVVAMLLAMSRPNITVIEATRMGEGLNLARQRCPDGVVVDRTLPDGDGLDLVRRLRAEPDTAAVPIVLVTAGHDPRDRSDMLRAGADEYLAKPFDPDDLEQLLRSLLNVPASERAHRRNQAPRLRPLRAATEEGAPSIVLPTEDER
ncbi:MAG: response regulator [Acidimicrobiales bacterium]